MSKRKKFKIGILLIVIALSLGLYQFFREYAAVNEEVRLRTAYYVKTGQILNVVQKDFLEGSTVESSNTDVAEITNNGEIEAKKLGVATVTVTKPMETEQTPDSSSTPAPSPAPSVDSIDPNTLTEEEKEEYEQMEVDSVTQEEYKISYDFDVIVKQPVEGVKLNVEIAQLIEGETIQLEPIFIPENAYNKTVSYQSLNNDVATVSENGLVTAKKSGETTVEIVTQDGGFHSNCTIKVFAKKENNNLYVKENSFELFTDEKVQVNASVTPNIEENRKIRYQSSDSNIFTIDGNGVITGKLHGQAELIVTYENIEKRIPVTVKEVVATSLQVNPKAVTLEIGQSKPIIVDIEPKNTLDKNVNYSSSNSDVADVVKGKILGKKEGTATLKVRTNNGLEQTVEVTVISQEHYENREVRAIDFNETSHTMQVGDTYRIKYNIEPKEASSTPINFTSSDQNIAVVDSFGNVSAVGAGSAIITGGVGKAGDRMTITVEDVPKPPTSITVSPTSINGLVGEVISLSTSILPVKNNNTSLTYKSSNDNVASVSQTGVVTLRKEGKATITVTTSNKLTATVNVVVTAPPMITLNKQAINLVQDKTEQLVATVKNSKDKSIIWSSQNPTIATVDQKGKVKAIASSGTTTITAALKSDPSVVATVTVTVAAKKISVTSITVTNENTGIDLINHLFVLKNTTVNLKITLNPTNTSDKANVSFVDGQPTNLVHFVQNGNQIKLQALNTDGTTKIKIQAGNITKTIIVQVESGGDEIYFTCKSRMNVKNENTWLPGDAIIIRSNNSYGMVDTARNASTDNPKATEDLFSVLNGLGIKTLDFIIITHWDGDHYGNLLNIIKNYDVKKVYAKTYYHNGKQIYSYQKYDPKNADARKYKKEIIQVISGEKEIEGSQKKVGRLLATPTDFTFHNMSFTVYNTKDIYQSRYDQCVKKGGCGENPNSLIYLVKVNGKKILLSGDSTTSVQKTPFKEIGKVDVYKVSHHGYKWNNSSSSLSLIKPTYAVVTNRKSRFGNYNDSASGHINNAGIKNIQKYTKNIYYAYDKVIISRYTNDNIYFEEAPATL